MVLGTYTRCTTPSEWSLSVSVSAARSRMGDPSSSLFAHDLSPSSSSVNRWWSFYATHGRRHSMAR